MGMMADAKVKLQEALGDAASVAGFTMTYERNNEGAQLQKYTALLRRPDGGSVTVIGRYPGSDSPDKCARLMASAYVSGDPADEIEIRG